MSAKEVCKTSNGWICPIWRQSILLSASFENINWGGAFNLRNQHLKARLSCSKSVQNWFDADAKNKIIFCDETRMELHFNKHKFIRRPRVELAANSLET